MLSPFDSLSSLESPSTPIIKHGSLHKKPVKSTIIPNQYQQKQRLFNSYIPPSQYIPKKITLYQHLSRHQRILVPSLTPIGIDPHQIISQRNKRVLSRIQHTIDNNENSKSIKDLILVKSLKLLQKQQKVVYFLTEYEIVF